MRVVVSDICTQDAIEDAKVVVGRSSKMTDASGLATFDSLPVGSTTATATKHFQDADYARFVVQYPRVLWRTKAISKETGDAEVTDGGTADIAIDMVVFRLLVEMIFKRVQIKLSGDQYGHWWTEIDGSESYGWWPKYPLGAPQNRKSQPPQPPPPLPANPSWQDRIQHQFDRTVYDAQSAWYNARESTFGQTLRGVEGELNGQTSFGGTPTKDPHHGDTGDEEYQPVLDDCRQDATIKAKARTFAASYSGGWSWRFEGGNHCHTFQKKMMADCDLQKFKVLK